MLWVVSTVRCKREQKAGDFRIMLCLDKCFLDCLHSTLPNTVKFHLPLFWNQAVGKTIMGNGIEQICMLPGGVIAFDSIRTIAVAAASIIFRCTLKGRFS